jgi:Polyketide cyclase / dehydrase and lipid transport
MTREDQGVADHSYSFRSVWTLGAPAADVYQALERLADYPAWWPEIKEVRPRSEDEYELRCRSLLPYDLVFTTHQTRRDPQARVLEARLAGDLEGFSRWTIQEFPEGARATFEEEVVANKALLRRLDPMARPAFRANHKLMMRHGERGLRTYLAGRRARWD